MDQRISKIYIIAVTTIAVTVILIGAYAWWQGYSELGLNTVVSGLLALVLGFVGYMSLKDFLARRELLKKRGMRRTK